MLEFDALNDVHEIEIKKSTGTVIVAVHPLGKAEFRELKNLEKAFQAINDDKDNAAVERLDLIYKQLILMAPGSKESDYTGMSLHSLVRLMELMISLAVGQDDEQKKTVERQKPPMQRRRRRSA